MSRPARIDSAPGRTKVARLIEACIKRSATTDDWASRARNFDVIVGGVCCNVHVKAQALRQIVGSSTRITGELFVYVTSRQGSELAGGLGWLHFVAAESAAPHCAFVYDMVFEEAIEQLRNKPLFRALVEQALLKREITLLRPLAICDRSRL